MPIQRIEDAPAPRPSRPREAPKLGWRQEELPVRVLSPVQFVGEGEPGSQPRFSDAILAPHGDHGATDEAATASRKSEAWAMQYVVGEAVKPLAVQVEDNGAAVRQMAEVLSKFGRRMEERLKEERLHNDIRFEEHEKLMTTRAEGRLSRLTRHLEAVQATQRQAAEAAAELGERLPRKTTFALGEDPPSSAEVSSTRPPTPSLSEGAPLAPLEASLRRIEAALNLRSTSLHKHEAAAALGTPRHSGAAALSAAACAAAAAHAAPFALKGVWAVGCEGGRSEEAASAGLAKTQDPPVVLPDRVAPEELQSQARPDDVKLEELQSQARPDDVKLEETRVDVASVSPSSRGVSSQKIRESQGLEGRGSVNSANSVFNRIKLTFSRSKSSDSVECGQRPSLFGMDYEEILHYHTRANGYLQKKISHLLLHVCVCWHQLQEPPRTSCLARLVSSYTFEGLCAAVICTNAGFMAYWANQRAASLSDAGVSLSAEIVFLAWYIVEVSLKMLVHRIYFFVGPEMNWNIFDLILVVLALSDFFGTMLISNSRTSFSDATLLRSLRVLKMAKILRVMRIMRVFDDLRLMLTSVIGSCVSLLWSFLMLAFVYYIFGLVFVQSMTDFLIERGDNVDAALRRDVLLHFGSLGQAMLSLFKATNGGNDWDYYYAVIAPTGWLNCAMFIVFIGFIQISLMNILTALFVERAMRLAQPDTISQAREQRHKEIGEAEELRRMCMEMDSNNSGTVSADEFRRHIESDEMRCYFSVLGLDIRNAQEFFDMLLFIGDDDEVDIESFVQGCLRMRGNASGIAQQNLIMETRLLRRNQCELFQQFARKLDALAERLPK